MAFLPARHSRDRELLCLDSLGSCLLWQGPFWPLFQFPLNDRPDHNGYQDLDSLPTWYSCKLRVHSDFTPRQRSRYGPIKEMACDLHNSRTVLIEVSSNDWEPQNCRSRWSMKPFKKNKKERCMHISSCHFPFIRVIVCVMSWNYHRCPFYSVE